MHAHDPQDEIARLEVRIDELATRIENCRKVALAAQVVIALGGVLLAALVFGAIRFDNVSLLAATAALLGGIVLLGSNNSTANEASAQLAAAEAQRAALIGMLDLHDVGASRTLH